MGMNQIRSSAMADDEEYISNLDTEPLAKEALSVIALQKLKKKLEARSETSYHNLPSKVGLAGMTLLYSDPIRLRQHFLPLEDFLEDGEVANINIAIINCDLGPEFHTKSLETLRHAPLINVAVEVNEMCIRFRDDGLVCFGNFDSLYSYNVATISLKEEQDLTKLNALCQVCCDYNKDKTYHPVTCNSFHFVKDVLTSLSLPYSDNLPDNQLGRYIGKVWEKIHENPDHPIPLNNEKSFLCPFSQKLYLFTKHCDLDRYLSISGTVQNLFITFPSDFLYLKVIDRSFWIDWILTNLKDESSLPDNNGSISSSSDSKPLNNCPLQDPFFVENKENY